MKKARFRIKSGDLELKEIEMNDPPTIEEVCEIIAKLKEEEKEKLAGLISVTNVDEPEKEWFFSTSIILNRLRLYDQKFKIEFKRNGVKKLTLTPLRVELLLVLLRKNDWMYISEIYEHLKDKTTQEGLRRIVKTKEMELFLDVDTVRVSPKKPPFYRVKPKQDSATFFLLMSVFRRLGETKRFLTTKYVSENIFRCERDLEEKLEILDQKTETILKYKDEILSNPDKLADPFYYSDFVKKLNKLLADWSQLSEFWLHIEMYCESCDRRESCISVKAEKYKEGILADQLELYKSQKNPGRVVHAYCFTVPYNLWRLYNKITFLKGEIESNRCHLKKLDLSSLDKLIIKLLTGPKA